MRLVYRDVEYQIHSVDETEWTWDAYPKQAYVAGTPLHGKLTGTDADAIKAGEAAIDEAFDGENSN
jgi:hypothetical protein